MQRDHKKQAFLFLLICILCFQLIDGAAIIQYLQQLLVSVDQRRAAFIVVILKILTIIVAPLSGSVLYGIVGMLFPFWWSVIYLSVGNFLGITLSYQLGKKYGRSVIRYIGGTHRVDQGHRLLDKMHNRHTFLGVRLTLFFVEDLINFLGGMAKVRFLPFIIISMAATTVFMLLVLWGVDGLLILLGVD